MLLMLMLVTAAIIVTTVYNMWLIKVPIQPIEEDLGFGEEDNLPYSIEET